MQHSYYVDVQRHFLWNKRQWKWMLVRYQSTFILCKEIWKKDNGHSFDLFLRRSGTPSLKTVSQGVWDNMAERRMLEFAESGHSIFRAISPLSRGRLKSKGHSNCRYTILQTSSVFTELSRRCVKSMNPFTRELWDPLWWRNQVPHPCSVWSRQKFFGLWWLGQQRSSTSVFWRTNWKAVTTRQIEKVLYGCKISECCWNWTIVQDENHCRSHTITCSGLSWIHSSTERMDPKKHQNWARLRSCHQLLARQMWSWD